MLLTKTVCKNDVKLKLFLKLMQRVYQNIELFFFLFYSLSTNVFQLEENVSKSPEKRNPQGLSIVFV